MNKVSMSVTAKGKRWEILHSLWIGWTFTLGIFSWVAFFYIGIRARQRKWILWGVLYLVPIAVVILLLNAGASAALGVPAVLLTLGLGVTSIFHAFRVRKDYLVRLARAKTVQGNVKGARSTRGPSEGREADTDQPDKGMSPERTHSEAETLDEGGSRQDVGEQRSAPRDYVRTPASGNHVLLPYEELFSVCAGYEGGYYHVGEAIGQKRLTNAHSHFPIPDYDAVRNKEYVVATCLDFSGDHPVGRKVQERYQGIPKKQDLYILQDGKEWISLYPYISVHYCPHCNARETYFVDAWQGTGEEANLRSFERSHEEVSEEIGQELTLRLER